jgi:hypothetical protein
MMNRTYATCGQLEPTQNWFGLTRAIHKPHAPNNYCLAVDATCDRSTAAAALGKCVSDRALDHTRTAARGPNFHVMCKAYTT